MKTKLTLFVTVLAAALFGMGCASTLDEGLVAYYPFNGNAKDESGNGHHGEVNGAALGLDRYGTSGSVYNFDGINDYIDLGHLNYNQGNSFAIAFWFKPRADWKNQYVIDMRQADAGGKAAAVIYNAYGKNSLTYIVYGSGTHWVPFEVSLKVDSYYHIVVLHNSNSQLAVCYVNGKKSNSIPMISLKMEGSNMRVGYRLKTGKDSTFTAGSIDDIRIYNRALSAEEVKALYDLEKPEVQ